MKARLVASLLLLLPISAAGADAVDTGAELARRAAAGYAERIGNASGELNETRRRILREQEPLAKAAAEHEQRIIELEAEIATLDTLNAQKTERRQQLSREAATLRNNFAYLTTLAQDTLKTAEDSLLPGEASLVGGRIRLLVEQLEASTGGTGAQMETIDLVLARLERQLGGYAARGTALVGEENRLVPGVFAFVGPEAYFRADAGSAGTVRTREGGFAIAYPVDDWDPAGLTAFFDGRMGSIAADPSAGKALRLREVNGNVFEHVRRGGVVAYAILVVGLLAILIIIQKVRDVRAFRIDAPAAVQAVLAVVRRGSRADIEAAVVGLRSTTRELFETGLRHIEQPRTLLEEHLFARTLQMRLHYERRLPLLAVIATAAPLMGLLGTVMGMVKTFALITVFGTGNAGKLSGGISEVLVATELGLMVAIPALVVHGFLAHRIQKDLAVLDRYAVEFVTAAEEARSGSRSGEYISA